MWLITEYAGQDEAPKFTLTLPFELRQKARLKAELDNGQAVGLQLERGNILRGGDKLKAENGEVIEVAAADESVSTIESSDALLLARVCYHLGNRHVPLQIGEGFCRYTHDHVLDDMARKLGATVSFEQTQFEPEPGAYSGTAQSHSH